MLNQYKINFKDLRRFVNSIAVIGFLVGSQTCKAMKSEETLTEDKRLFAILVKQAVRGKIPHSLMKKDPESVKGLKDKAGDFVDQFDETYLNKKGERKSLIYIDILKTPNSMNRAYGRAAIFETNPIWPSTKKAYFEPFSGYTAFDIPERLSFVTYCIDPFSKWEDKILPAERFCHVNWVVTNKNERHKGYASFILEHFIDSTFLMSSTIGFISADIAGYNGPSQMCFRGLGFVEIESREITLDGGKTVIDVGCKLDEDNFYLSRFEWNKRRSQLSTISK